MKRSFWAITGILIILEGGIVFSQEVAIGRGKLVFNGRVASGVFFDINSTTNKDGTFTILNQSYADSPYDDSLRVDLSTTYTIGNGGLKIGLRASDVVNQLGGDSPGLFSVPYASGWVDLLDNKLRVAGGKISDNIWGTMGMLNSTITAAGLRLEVKPIEGLNAGVFFVVPGKTSAGAADPTQTLMETIFGFRYVNPTFWVSGLLQLDGDFDTAPSTLSSVVFEDDKELRAIAGVGFTGIPKLSIVAEADIWGLSALSDQGRVDLRETIGYAINDKFRVDVRAQELLWLYNDDLDPWLEIKPLFSYKINNTVTTIMEAGFGLGAYGEAELETAIMGAVPRVAGINNYQIYVKPTAQLTLDGGLAVKTWYRFTIYEPKDMDSETKNQVALEFAWTF